MRLVINIRNKTFARAEDRTIDFSVQNSIADCQRREDIRFIVKDLEILEELRRTLSLEGEAILATVREIDSLDSEKAKAWLRAMKLLHEALERGGKVVVTGVGKSGKIAQKIAATLASTGSEATYLHPTEGLHGDLGFVGKKDVILALSYTGNTEEILRILPAFQALKTPIIAITGNSKSHLAAGADAVIDASVSVEACPHNLAPTTSTTLALAIGDALAIGLMKVRGFNAENFAVNHPGGSLGRKLNLTVDACMQKGDAVGIVSEDTKMDEVVVIATQKRSGAVLVVRGKLLVGLITDGDIRKSLTLKERFFQLQAAEVMTKNPVTATPEMPARDAIALMENRKSQINVLPVIDRHGNWIGLLRLHDLLQTF
ncbi:MAG: KpsF/GutQ family sugar-phosphate isomerase [Cryobacterium sp.]|nr:KpsF/GutQ family sugar-phosphate isomerase [Oligoflexia bacterium]